MATLDPTRDVAHGTLLAKPWLKYGSTSTGGIVIDVLKHGQDPTDLDEALRKLKHKTYYKNILLRNSGINFAAETVAVMVAAISKEFADVMHRD